MLFVFPEVSFIMKEHNIQLISIAMYGGDEPLSVTGHLGGGEPIVKPTFLGRFLCFAEEGGGSF